MSQEKTRAVEQWWNDNPFTYNGVKGVGKSTAEPEELDLAFFTGAEARYKKHSGQSTQSDDKPVFSKYINYENWRGKTVLDIATGTGFSAATFAQFGAKVTGIDLTDYAVRATKRHLELKQLKGTVVQMDAQDLKFPDHTFDFVCAHGCLMHMPDTDKAVREIYRVLKPGGQVYAWMYHRGWYYWFGILFLRGILMGKFITYNFSPLRLTSRYSDGAHEAGNPHTKFYSRGGFKRLFKRGGFRDIKVYANYNPGEWASWPVATVSLGRFVPTSIQRFLSSKIGFALSCSVTATKEPGK